MTMTATAPSAAHLRYTETLSLVGQSIGRARALARVALLAWGIGDADVGALLTFEPAARYTDVRGRVLLFHMKDRWS